MKPKRPADVVGNAVRVAKIATGELVEVDDTNTAAQSLGRKGGKKRAEALTPERRSEIARKAAAARWMRS